MTRLVPSEVLMCYDGSFEGFFTTVFQVYARHIFPAGIAEARDAQPALCQPILDIETDIALAERVKVGICNKAGFNTYLKLQRAFASDEPGKEMCLLKFVIALMERGRSTLSNLTDPVVCEVEKLALRVENEMEDMRQFVRFRQLEHGGYLSVINPRANLVPLIMSHFAERLNSQPFVIYDEVHHIAGVYDLQRCYFVKSDQLALPDDAAEEKRYRQLWKTFYDAVSNEQRYNPDLRRNMMPKRFWKNITEFSILTHSDEVLV